ncbi:TPA: RHS repeat-associated core domain-containing protein, partial [Escherichia coli]
TDPIGLNGGLNLYAYAPNPLSWIDPLGLFCGTAKNAKWNKARQNVDGPGQEITLKNMAHKSAQIQ